MNTKYALIAVGLLAVILLATCKIQKSSDVRSGSSTQIATPTSTVFSPGDSVPRTVPDELKELRDDWLWLGRWTQFATIALGIISVMATVLVSALEPDLRNLWGGNGRGTRIVAAIAAISTALLTTFNLTHANENIWTAWRNLNTAILHYQYDPKDVPDTKDSKQTSASSLIDTYSASERIIGNVTLVISTNSAPANASASADISGSAASANSAPDPVDTTTSVTPKSHH